MCSIFLLFKFNTHILYFYLYVINKYNFCNFLIPFKCTLRLGKNFKILKMARTIKEPGHSCYMTFQKKKAANSNLCLDYLFLLRFRLQINKIRARKHLEVTRVQSSKVFQVVQ